MNKIKKLKLPREFENVYRNLDRDINQKELNILYSLIEYQYKTISIKEKTRISIHKISSILYIKSSSNYSSIYLDNGREILTSKTLKYWESKIDNNSFIRSHNSYLINTRYVTGIYVSQNEIILRDIRLPISKPNKKIIMDFFK